MYSIQSKDGYYFFTKTGKPGRKKFTCISKGVYLLVEMYGKGKISQKEYLGLYHETVALPLPLIIESERVSDVTGPVTCNELSTILSQIVDSSRIMFFVAEDYPNPTLVVRVDDPTCAEIIYKDSVISPIRSKHEGCLAADVLKDQGRISRIQCVALKKQLAESTLPDITETTSIIEEDSVIDLRPYASSLN